jgi:hypothetical protein
VPFSPLALCGTISIRVSHRGTYTIYNLPWVASGSLLFGNFGQLNSRIYAKEVPRCTGVFCPQRGSYVRQHFALRKVRSIHRSSPRRAFSAAKHRRMVRPRCFFWRRLTDRPWNLLAFTVFVAESSAKMGYYRERAGRPAVWGGDSKTRREAKIVWLGIFAIPHDRALALGCNGRLQFAATHLWKGTQPLFSNVACWYSVARLRLTGRGSNCCGSIGAQVIATQQLRYQYPFG